MSRYRLVAVMWATLAAVVVGGFFLSDRSAVQADVNIPAGSRPAATRPGMARCWQEWHREGWWEELCTKASGTAKR